MIDLIKWAGVLVCLFVLAGCICRIDIMRAGRNIFGWRFIYIMTAPFSGGILIDLLTNRPVDWYVCFGMAAMSLHFILTRRLWRKGSPQYTMPGGLT